MIFDEFLVGLYRLIITMKFANFNLLSLYALGTTFPLDGRLD
jgi:hypothetical protein